VTEVVFVDDDDLGATADTHTPHQKLISPKQCPTQESWKGLTLWGGGGGAGSLAGGRRKGG